jgi:putative serine protease PepD
MRRPAQILILVGVLLSLVASLAGSGQTVRAMDKTVKQQVLRASVKLMTPFDADPNGGSLCSGSMLNQQGYILTNFHCIGYVTSGGRESDLDAMGLRPGDFYNKKALSLVAITDDPRQLPKPSYVAQVMASDSNLDVAVLKVIAYYNGKQKLPATLPVVSMNVADSDSVETLDEVFVIGYPGIAGDSVTATEGKISGFLDENSDGNFDWFKTDVLVNQGNSGGSAVNDNGELIGIPTARLQDKSGNVIYLIRPVNVAAPYIKQAMKTGGSTTSVGNQPTTPAANATPPAASNQPFGPLTFGTGFTDNSGVTGKATSFGSGVAEVHAGLPYQNMRNGTAWGYNWQLDGADVTGQPNVKWQYGASGILDLYLKGKNGLSDGTYNLQVFLKGQLVQEGSFVVGQQNAGPLQPEKPAVSNNDGVIVTGTVVDHSTGKAILGAIVVFLQPGKSVDDFDNDNSKGKTDTLFSYGVTNAAGQFTIDTPLPRGEVYTAIVGAKGYQRIAENDALEIRADDPDMIELDPLQLDKQ